MQNPLAMTNKLFELLRFAQYDKIFLWIATQVLRLARNDSVISPSLSTRWIFSFCSPSLAEGARGWVFFYLEKDILSLRESATLSKIADSWQSTL
ncbi:hypothetical protein [Helicobacter sp. T3_23-1056]